MSYPKLLGVAFLTIFAAVAVTAQDVDDVVRTETTLVQLNVGVVDKQGRAVTSLTQKDFAIYEDGVKQSIQHFEPVDAPFSLVLMLDMSGSTVNFRQQLKLASERFLDALRRGRVAQIDVDDAGFHLDRINPQVVAAVDRRPGLQVELPIVPVTRQHALRVEHAFNERIAFVRATVVARKDVAVVHEERDVTAAELDGDRLRGCDALALDRASPTGAVRGGGTVRHAE